MKKQLESAAQLVEAAAARGSVDAETRRLVEELDAAYKALAEQLLRQERGEAIQRKEREQEARDRAAVEARKPRMRLPFRH